MATQVLTIVGGAIGFYLGGPVGASIGMSIGGYIGKTFEPTQVLEGPRLDDLTVTYSTYGASIPIHYGEYVRTAGNVIVTSGLVETEKTEEQDGGKGGGGGTETKTYSYSMSLAVSLGRGPLRNMRRIWANGKLLWDITKLADNEAAAQAAYDDAVAAADAAETAYYADESDATYNSWQAALDAVDAADAALTAATAARAIETSTLQSWSISAGAGLPEGPLGYLAFYPGDKTQTPDPVLEAILGTGEVPGYRDLCYIVLGNLQLADYGNSMPSIEVELDGLEIKSSGAILQNICERAGLSQGQFSVGVDKTEICGGYSISSAGSALACVQQLAEAYRFDIIERAGNISFVNRGLGMSTCPEVGEYDAVEAGGSHSGNPVNPARTEETSLPREVSVTYSDPDRDYQEGTQRAQALTNTATEIRNVSIPIVMSADKARALADKTLWEAWVGRVSCSFVGSDRLGYIVPGDSLVAPYRSTYSAYRVESVTRGDNGLIEISARLNDPNVYESAAAGAETTVPTQTVPSVGATVVYVANTPIIGSADTDTCITWGMTAAEADWRGGQMFKSADLGISWASVASAGPRSTLGTVATATPAGAVDLWDMETTIRVVLGYDAQELSSCTEDEVLNGKNGAWIGAADGSHGEVIQYTTATLVTASPKTYDLSGLLRGRRGTEHEVGLHGANEVFMKVTIDSLRTLDFGWPDVDLLRWYKGVSLYQSTTSVTSHLTFTNTAERAKPRAPVQGEGTRDSSNNLTITWVRRIRGYAPIMGYGEVPLDEPTEAYEVDVYKTGSVVRTISTNTPTASYTAAQQTADGITPGSAVTVKIYQISGTRGRGHAGEFTI